MHRRLLLLTVLAVTGAAGCSKLAPNTAIKAAVRKHLHQNPHLMLNSFTTRFERISRKGDAAEALVRYQSKNLPRLTVEVRYGLQKINGQWQVTSSSSVNGQLNSPANPHEGAGTASPPETDGAPGPIASH
jgi:hypothetical protein